MANRSEPGSERFGIWFDHTSSEFHWELRASKTITPEVSLVAHLLLALHRSGGSVRSLVVNRVRELLAGEIDTPDIEVIVADCANEHAEAATEQGRWSPPTKEEILARVIQQRDRYEAYSRNSLSKTMHGLALCRPGSPEHTALTAWLEESLVTFVAKLRSLEGQIAKLDPSHARVITSTDFSEVESFLEKLKRTSAHRSVSVNPLGKQKKEAHLVSQNLRRRT